MIGCARSSAVVRAARGGAGTVGHGSLRAGRALPRHLVLAPAVVVGTALRGVGGLRRGHSGRSVQCAGAAAALFGAQGCDFPGAPDAARCRSNFSFVRCRVAIT